MLHFILQTDSGVVIHFSRLSYKKAFHDAKAYLQDEADPIVGGATKGRFMITPLAPKDSLHDAIAAAKLIKDMYIVG